MSLDPANDGSFVRNMENRQGSWAVRPGFGLLYRGDSTMSINGSSSSPLGYKKHLGSYALKTAFGHTQIITVLSANLFTGESREVGTYATVYSVSVFDVNDNVRVEHVLHKVTGDGGRSFHETRVLKACYETAADKAAANWTMSGAQPVAFQELAGNLYFSNDDIGVYVYRPSLVVERNAQLQGADDYDWSPARGEVSSVTPVVFSDGLNTEAFNYVTNSDLAGVSAMCEHQGSLVYASGNTIFYSDAFLPNNIKASNSDIIPVLSNITGLASNGQLIYVFSDTETWVIQPALTQTGLLSGGILTKLSSEVGCVAPSALMTAKGVPIWVSSRGVHAISGNFDYATLSDPIQEYWRAGVSDPFSHYATQAGLTGLALQQPESFSAPPTAPHVGYNEHFDEIYCSFDSKVWVFSNETWLLWDFENYFYSPTPSKVVATTPVNQAQALSLLGETYVVSLDNPTEYPGQGLGSVTARPYSIYELGRGGGTDGSFQNEKDVIVRNMISNLRLETQVAPESAPAFYFELTEINASGEYVFLLSGVPPDLLAPASQAPTRWQFELGFNTTYWKPVMSGGTHLSYSVPHERQGTAAGIFADRWEHGVGSDIAGNSIMIIWAAAGRQELNLRNKNPLIYVKFEPVDATKPINTFGWAHPAGYVAQIDDGVLPTDIDASVYVNELSYTTEPAVYGLGQPVNYLYKAPTTRSDNSDQLRTRGLYTRITSHGKAVTGTTPYPYGLYNAAFGSDNGIYNSQVVDGTDGLSTAPEKISIRTRIQNSAGTMVQKVFSIAKYGDPAVAATGDLLIDNEQVDSIAMSTSARGGSIGVTLFGFIKDKAESVRLHAARMTYKVIGGARRRGR
tara:strand:+ start:814 stop:3372 length:2559 start_codon:yes stop_codon:yes gene_type:complete